jgi:hypothetical protein
MANLQSTNITGVLTVNGSAVGGGLTPKFQEFNSSGTFTPSQALIDAGGYIEVFLVAGGGGRDTAYFNSGAGGEVLIKKMYLTSTSNVSVTIGSGGTEGNQGGNSAFNGSSAGGVNIAARGGGETSYSYRQIASLGAGFGVGGQINASAGSGSFGYGAGGGRFNGGGVYQPKANSGQGASSDISTGGSGYCLVMWYE